MKVFKSLLRFLEKNYFLAVFSGIVFFVGIFITYKFIFSKPTYIYVKVKMSQGSWWASTMRPSLWFIKSLKNEFNQNKYFNKSDAKVLSVKYYPWYSTNTYDVFLTLKLKVDTLKNGAEYAYKRSTIGVGAPIDLELSRNQLSGTIIDFSNKLFKEEYVIKTISLKKKYSLLWEYDAIQIGDKYNDGVQTVFEIIDKEILKTSQYNMIGELSQVLEDYRNDILVKGKIKLKKVDNKLIYGEEQIIIPGQTINLATDNYLFTEYLVIKIE